MLNEEVEEVLGEIIVENLFLDSDRLFPVQILARVGDLVRLSLLSLGSLRVVSFDFALFLLDPCRHLVL